MKPPKTTTAPTWYESNQRYLLAELAPVRQALRHYIQRTAKHAPSDEGEQDSSPDRHEIAAEMPVPPALDTLGTIFGLSSFERAILLLCAGIELDGSFASMCATAQGDPQHTYPTFSLALAVLPNAYWSSLAPTAPLRYWRLIEVGPGKALTLSPLRISERVLHYLIGIQHLDERLMGLVEPMPHQINQSGDAYGETLVPSHRALSDQIAAIWSRASGVARLPVIQLCGSERSSKRSIALAACSALGLRLHAMRAEALPGGLSELEALICLWEREAALSKSALLLDCDEFDTTDIMRTNLIVRLIERLNSALIVSSLERRRALDRAVLTFDVSKPNRTEQIQVWQHVLGAAPNLNGQIDELVSQFDLDTHAIHSASAEVLGKYAADQQQSDQAANAFSRSLWDACRLRARPRLDDLAQRIEPSASHQDLVLPENQRQILRSITIHVRQRTTVYTTWGFATKGTRGLGISALFAGASGTGKTMAAEVLAGELALDLYRIDLSSVVSKYIGETEKNLRRIFDAAEEGGVILLFDEADALFGKRSEVKDSHDRYANIEVSYLLQRMEAYRGLAILTTNLKKALDDAFQRRLRFVVQFPFPDAKQRMEIWQRVFPAATPVANLDYDRLAQLNIAGGNIRNIALNAAFLAAHERQPIHMKHVRSAARSEYAKMEKTLTEAELAGWGIEE
jgi:SpoVK/Ycf46/Vps4 family AAA+-type ATPase